MALSRNPLVPQRTVPAGVERACDREGARRWRATRSSSTWRMPSRQSLRRRRGTRRWRPVRARAVSDGRLRVLRVNALDTEWGADDLAAAATLDIDAVLVPKVGRTRRCPAVRCGARRCVVRRGRLLGHDRDVPGGRAASGDRRLRWQRRRLAGFVLGTNDLALEMRARPTPDRAGDAAHPDARASCGAFTRADRV